MPLFLIISLSARSPTTEELLGGGARGSVLPAMETFVTVLEKHLNTVLAGSLIDSQSKCGVSDTRFCWRA